MNYQQLKFISVPVISGIAIFLSSSIVMAQKPSINDMKLPVMTLKKKVAQVDPPLDCYIKFGRVTSAESPKIRLKNNKVTKVDNIGGPWSFISRTGGPCSFSIYNKNNFKGRKVTYGSGLDSQRIAVTGTDSSSGGGWKARSVIITPYIKPECSVTLSGEYSSDFKGFKKPGSKYYVTQIFYGPSRINDITAWSLVSRTSGNSNCVYTVYNKNNLRGRVAILSKIDKRTRVGWKIRSIEISQK